MAAKAKELSKARKKREISPSLTPADGIAAFSCATTAPCHPPSARDRRRRGEPLDGNVVATGGSDGSVALFDASKGKRVSQLAQHKKRVRGLAWAGRRCSPPPRMDASRVARRDVRGDDGRRARGRNRRRLRPPHRCLRGLFRRGWLVGVPRRGRGGDAGRGARRGRGRVADTPRARCTPTASSTPTPSRTPRTRTGPSRRKRAWLRWRATSGR